MLGSRNSVTSKFVQTRKGGGDNKECSNSKLLISFQFSNGDLRIRGLFNIRYNSKLLISFSHNDNINYISKRFAFLAKCSYF